jgi:hypothetical protein
MPVLQVRKFGLYRNLKGFDSAQPDIPVRLIISRRVIKNIPTKHLPQKPYSPVIDIMKEYLIKVPDELASTVMDSLASYSAVKVEELDTAEDDDGQTKEEILQGIREAVEEMNEITAGRKESVNAREWLDGLRS